MVMLTAISGSLASHRMVAMALAAIFCHRDGTNAFLQAGKARPG